MDSEKNPTQHALFQLLRKMQNWLDDLKYVGMVLMDLSKAYDCIPYDLSLAKLDVYGVDIKSLLNRKDTTSQKCPRPCLEIGQS